MKIIHIINSMANGGAESVLYRIIKNDNKNEHIIILLLSENFYKKELEKNNIIFYSINNKFNFVWFLKLILIPYYIYKHNPQVVQSWMYHSNILASFLLIFFPFKKIYWNIRHSNFQEKISFKYKFILKLSSLLSKIIPSKIIYCSNVSLKYHENIGFHNRKSVFIPNGFNDISSNINKDYKIKFMKKFGISEDIILFGNVSRWNIQKNHELLFKSLNIIKYKNNILKFKLILIGNGISKFNKKLIFLIKKYNLVDNIIILNPTSNIHDVYSLFDISLLSSSFGEGFSNFLSESMICGVPCVSTDIGDSSKIISNYGIIVASNKEDKFSKAIIEMINIKKNKQKWNKLKKNNKDHIINNFSFEAMLKKYCHTWNEK